MVGVIMSIFVASTNKNSAPRNVEKKIVLNETHALPAPVRLVNQPKFRDQVVERLLPLIYSQPCSRHYQLLVDIYRKYGNLQMAVKAAQEWKKFNPDDLKALRIYDILAQRSLSGNAYLDNELQPAPFAVIENFLSEIEREYYLQKAISAEYSFNKAGIGFGDDIIIDSYRRDTNVLRMDDSEKNQIREKIQSQINLIFTRFQMNYIPVKNIEVKLTAHGQGGFFTIHQDAFSEMKGSTRLLSWVYYFHSRPKKYIGGDLILFDSSIAQESHQFSPVYYTRYIPQDNQIIFFPSWFYHAVTPVHLQCLKFDSYRFAISGHVRC